MPAPDEACFGDLGLHCLLGAGRAAGCEDDGGEDEEGCFHVLGVLGCVFLYVPCGELDLAGGVDPIQASM